MKLYVDSNVFISLIREEVFLNRTLFDEALSFFEKVHERKDTIVISELTLKEIKKIGYTEKEEIVEQIKNKKIKAEYIPSNYKIEFTKFEKLGIHIPDSIHVAIAIKERCDCIVTFNIKDLKLANNFIKVIEPSEY